MSALPVPTALAIPSPSEPPGHLCASKAQAPLCTGWAVSKSHPAGSIAAVVVFRVPSAGAHMKEQALPLCPGPPDVLSGSEVSNPCAILIA